jgi:small-conductance mechanosensitive channel
VRAARCLATLDHVNQSILDSLFLAGGFNPDSFPDLFYPLTIAALVFLVGTIVLYNVQTRRLRRHPPLVNLNEWLFWTGLAVFGLLLVYSIFAFYFVFVLGTIVVGVGTMIWIRWFRFPPLIVAYNSILRREQYLSQKRYATAESTIRSKAKGRPKAKPKSKKKKRR